MGAIKERLWIWWRRYVLRYCYECGGYGRTAWGDNDDWCPVCHGTGKRPR